MSSFKSLVYAVSEQYQEIKHSLALFPYFETWDPHLIAECCRVSSIEEFLADEIILGSDTGNSHSVYFVLEGVCKIVQNLYVEFKTDFRDEKHFKLYKYTDPKKDKIVLKSEGYSSKLFNDNYNFHVVEKYETANCFEEVKNDGNENEIPNNADKKMEKKTDALKEQVQDIPDDTFKLALRQVNANFIAELKKRPEFDGSVFTPVSENEKAIHFRKETSEKPGKPEHSAKSGKAQVIEGAESMGDAIYKPDHHLKILQECKKRRSEKIWICNKYNVREKPKIAKNFFIQIGLLFKGACFGLEKIEEQNFVSLTKVKCLKIPQIFLLQHNPCNIWKRISLFHSLYVPKVEKIFECFQCDRKWTVSKKKRTEEIFYSTNLLNFTSVSDVPYSLRLADLR